MTGTRAPSDRYASMAYIDGAFASRGAKRRAIFWLSVLAAGSFVVGFLRNSGLDVAPPPEVTPPPTPVVAVPQNPQPILQAPAVAPAKVVAEAAPALKKAPPVIDIPVQPPPPPAEAVAAEPLPPPTLPAEPLEPVATIPPRR